MMADKPRVRLQPVVTREIATTRDGRDITRGYISSDQYLWPQDELLSSVGAGFGTASAYAGYKLYEDMLQDDRVFSTLQQRRSALVAREMKVTPGGTMRRDKMAAEFIEEVLEHVRWDTVSERMHYGIHYGYSVAECLWARDGRRVMLDAVKVRNRRRFVFSQDYQPLLVTTDNPMGEELPPRKFWHFATGADNDDEPYGRGLGYYLYWPVWFKKNQIKFWLIALEKFGAPTAIGKYHKSSSDDERRKLLSALRSIHFETGIAVPEDVVIELLEAKRASSIDYEAFHSRMQEIITQIVLSQTMTSEDGSSESQARVHMDVRKELVESDAHLICDSFNRGPVTWLTEWNFPGAEIPKVERVMDEPPDMNQLVERDKTIKEIGYRPTKKYIENTYNIDVEDVPVPPPTPPGGMPPLPGPDSAELAEGDPGIGAARLDTLRSRAGPKIDAWTEAARSRLDTAASFAEFDNWLANLARVDLEIADVVELLAQAFTATLLAGRDDVENLTVELADDQTARLPFDEQITFFRNKLDLPTRTWTDIWQAEHNRSFVVAGAARDALVADLREAVTAAIADGETLESFRKRFDQIVAKHGWSYKGGRDWRTRVIYGTNLRTSYAAGRWQQLQAVKLRRPYWRYRHSPVSQEPREKHIAWDGLILLGDDPWWHTNYPPNGWGCNCFVEALSERNLKRLGKDGPDQAPPLNMHEETVGSGPSQRTVSVPEGIDPGFAYAPGRSTTQPVAP